MVYMHGGALSGGTGNDPLINALRLPSHGVVLVNVNMRLGPIGLLAHPLLSRESQKGVSGNYLFLDMLAALGWVQRNIAAFGGDPHNVTIFGESGGSVKIVVLMASPLAKGLFHRAIGESGSPTTDFFPGVPLKDAEAVGRQVFSGLGVDQAKDPLAAARALPWQQIIDAGQALGAEGGTAFGPWDSAVDGWFLPATAAAVFKAGRQNVVPFIMGANLGELTGPGIILMPQVIPAYVDLFINAHKLGAKAYGYIFDHVPSGWKKNGVVASHGIELHYVFGDWDPPGGVWPMGFNLAKASGARSADPGLGDQDREVSEAMMRLWANFAKTGNPSLKGLIDWPAYQQSADQYLYIAESLEIKSGFSRIAQK
jgi:para-nitrobenzyl esterase